MSEPATITDFTFVPGVRETASEDGAVLLDIEQGVCFSLNPVGLRIWELLKKRYFLDQIAAVLGQEFSVSRSQLLSDASKFIDALEAKRLIYRPGSVAASLSLPSRVPEKHASRFHDQGERVARSSKFYPGVLRIARTASTEAVVKKSVL